MRRRRTQPAIMKTAYFLTALFLVGAFSISNAQSLKTAEEYNNRGLEKQGRGDIDGAIADYTSAVSLKAKASTLATAYNNRANARISKNDLDGAIADYSKAIELQPADEENYYAYSSRDPSAWQACSAGCRKNRVAVKCL